MNFLYNGGFGNGLAQWIVSGAFPPAIAQVATPVKYGQFSMQVTAPSAGGGAWYDANYRYRKAINVAGSANIGTQNNPVAVLTVNNSSGSDSGFTVYTGGLCRADFADLRFTQGDKVTPLKYFLWKYAGSTAIVLVQLNSVPAAGATFYMYYGYSGASDVSDPSLFLKYDSMSLSMANALNNGDFEDGSLGAAPTGWSTWNGVTATNDNTHVYSGGHAAKLVGGSSGTGTFYQVLANYSSYVGKTCTAGAWVWASAPVSISINDVFVAAHPGDSQWHFLSATGVVSLSGNNNVYVDIAVPQGVTCWVDAFGFVAYSALPATMTYPVWAGNASYDAVNQRVQLNSGSGTQGCWLHYLASDPLSFGVIFEQKMTSGADSEFAFGESSDSFPQSGDNSSTGWNWVSDNYSSYTRVLRSGATQQSGGFDSLADNNFHTIIGLANQDPGTPANRDCSFSAPFDGISFSGTNVTAPAPALKFGWNARSGGVSSTHILGKCGIFTYGAFSVSSWGAQETFVPAPPTTIDTWCGQNRVDYPFYRGKTITFQAWLQCPVANYGGARVCLYDGAAEYDGTDIPADGQWHPAQVTATISALATALEWFVRVHYAGDIVYVNRPEALDPNLVPGDIIYHDGTRLLGLRAGPIGTNLISNDLGNFPDWGYPP